jgi:hypothetical protein
MLCGCFGTAGNINGCHFCSVKNVMKNYRKYIREFVPWTERCLFTYAALVFKVHKILNMLMALCTKCRIYEQHLFILNVFFWVFSRRPIVVCRRFGTVYQFHLQGLDVKYEAWVVRRGRGIYTKRIHKRFKTRRKIEIKNIFLPDQSSTTFCNYTSVQDTYSK